MPVTISGTAGVSKVQPGVVDQPSLANNVDGNGPAFYAAGTSAAQVVSSGVFTKVQLPLEIFDTANAFDATTNYRFQPTVPGYYEITGIVRFTATASGPTFEQVNLYGTNAILGVTANELVRGVETGQASRSATATQGMVSALLYMNGSSDYVELWAYLNASSPAFANTTVAARCSLQGHFVRAA